MDLLSEVPIVKDEKCYLSIIPHPKIREQGRNWAAEIHVKTATMKEKKMFSINSEEIDKIIERLIMIRTIHASNPTSDI